MPGTSNQNGSPSPQTKNPLPFPGMETSGPQKAKGAKSRPSPEVADVRQLNEEKKDRDQEAANQN